MGLRLLKLKMQSVRQPLLRVDPKQTHTMPRINNEVFEGCV
jgi:hypothetical protein